MPFALALSALLATQVHKSLLESRRPLLPNASNSPPLPAFSGRSAVERSHTSDGDEQKQATREAGRCIYACACAARSAAAHAAAQWTLQGRWLQRMRLNRLEDDAERAEGVGLQCDNAAVEPLQLQNGWVRVAKARQRCLDHELAHLRNRLRGPAHAVDVGQKSVS